MLIINDLRSVASIFRLTSPRSFLILPSSRTTPPALYLLQKTSTAICRSPPLRLSFLSPTSPPSFRRMSRCTCVRTRLTTLSRLSTRLVSTHLDIQWMRELVSAMRRRSLRLYSDAQSSFRRRIVVHPRSSSVFGELQIFVVTASILGSSSGVKPLVAEEKGVRVVRFSSRTRYAC